MTVRAAGDGYDLGEYVVVGGSVTLEQPAVLVHVGLPFEADFESLDLMVIGGESVATRIKNIREVGVLVQYTNQISAGAPGFDVLEDYKPRDAESMNLPAELRTEWLLINVSGRWEQNPRYYQRTKGPYKTVVRTTAPRRHQ